VLSYVLDAYAYCCTSRACWDKMRDNYESQSQTDPPGSPLSHFEESASLLLLFNPSPGFHGRDSGGNPSDHPGLPSPGLQMISIGYSMHLVSAPSDRRQPHVLPPPHNQIGVPMKMMIEIGPHLTVLIYSLVALGVSTYAILRYYR
jgi:hypothetical protein